MSNFKHYNNIYCFIADVEKVDSNSFFFSEKTLRFFGERLSDMRIKNYPITIVDWSNEEHECYILSTLQRKAPGGPTRHYAYFDTTTFEEISERKG